MVPKGQKIENVRVFERLPNKIGLRRRKHAIEVGDGLALPGMRLGLDHCQQDVAAPPVEQRLPHIPMTGSSVLDLLDQDDVMAPRNGPEK